MTDTGYMGLWVNAHEDHQDNMFMVSKANLQVVVMGFAWKKQSPHFIFQRGFGPTTPLLS